MSAQTHLALSLVVPLLPRGTFSLLADNLLNSGVELEPIVHRYAALRAKPSDRISSAMLVHGDAPIRVITFISSGEPFALGG